MDLKFEKVLVHYLKEMEREARKDERYRERAIGAIEIMYQTHLISRNDYYQYLRIYGVE